MSGGGSARRWEAGRLALRLALFLSMTGIALLVLMVVAFALPVFSAGESGGPFSWGWVPAQGKFGILPMIAGSLILGTSALALGWPLAAALCCWLIAPPPSGRFSRLSRALVGGLVRLMTAVPTVVYGFTAVFLLSPFIRSWLGGTGMSGLTAAVMLGVLILPTVVLVLQAGLGARLESVALSGAALGMDRMEVLWHVVLPRARGTLLASAILGFGRAIGDTMLPLMLAGNAPQLPASPLAALRTLTAHMALVTSNEAGSAAYDSLFMAGLILLTVNAVVSLCLRRLGGRS